MAQEPRPREVDHGGLSVEGRVGYKDSGCEEGEQHRTYSLHRRHVEPVHAQAVVRVEHRVAAVRVLRALHPPPGKVPQPGRPPPVDAREQERRERGKGIFFSLFLFFCAVWLTHLPSFARPSLSRPRTSTPTPPQRTSPYVPRMPAVGSLVQSTHVPPSHRHRTRRPSPRHPTRH